MKTGIEKEDRSNSRCRVCGGQTNGSYEAREMMLGLRTRFHYAQCDGCGALWLTDPPAGLGAYYAGGYYSFAKEHAGAKGWLTRYLREKRDRSYFGGDGLVGRALARRYEDCALPSISKLGVPRTARILDVGCGDGKLLRRMAAIGFRNLAGVDPFLSSEINNGNGIRIRRCRVEDLVGEQYDVVMFHHSLEHVEDPKGTLRAAERLLAPQGICLVRLPVVAHAWDLYGTDWAQLDPPRHMWVPTEKSMRLLADSVGLRVEGVDYDSTDHQFWGSELYRRDIPLRDIDWRHLGGYFSPAELAEFRRKASDLNLLRQGDQAAFILQSAGE